MQDPPTTLQKGDLQVDHAQVRAPPYDIPHGVRPVPVTLIVFLQAFSVSSVPAFPVAAGLLVPVLS